MLLALVLSALVHGLLLFGTDYSLPALHEPSPPVLHAVLQKVVPPPAPPPLAAPPPEPVTRPPRLATPAPAPAAGVPASPPAAASTPAPVAVTPAAPVAAPAPAVTIPNVRGGIRYQWTRGEQGLIVGQAQHRWEIQDGRYRMTAVIETAGLAALFRSVRVEQSSEGSIDASGFHPHSFRVVQAGKATIGADFAEGNVTTLGQPAIAAPTDAQDLLSVYYQLGWTQRQGTQTVAVATGKKFDRIRFEVVGEETLETPAGSFRTRHYRSSGEDVTEVWSALEYAGLPVKIRFTDRKGEVYDQLAQEIQLNTH